MTKLRMKFTTCRKRQFCKDPFSKNDKFVSKRNNKDNTLTQKRPVCSPGRMESFRALELSFKNSMREKLLFRAIFPFLQQLQRLK